MRMFAGQYQVNLQVRAWECTWVCTNMFIIQISCWFMFTYEEISTRNKTLMDITWLNDKSLADLDNLPDPEDLAADIIENLEAGLESFREIMVKLNTKS